MSQIGCYGHISLQPSQRANHPTRAAWASALTSRKNSSTYPELVSATQWKATSYQHCATPWTSSCYLPWRIPTQVETSERLPTMPTPNRPSLTLPSPPGPSFVAMLPHQMTDRSRHRSSPRAPGFHSVRYLHVHLVADSRLFLVKS